MERTRTPRPLMAMRNSTRKKGAITKMGRVRQERLTRTALDPKTVRKGGRFNAHPEQTKAQVADVRHGATYLETCTYSAYAIL